MINTSALSPGTVLQSPTRAYTIQAVLGQGGFGITYSATYFDIVDGEMTMMFAAVKEHFISSLSMRDPQTSQVINSTAVAGRVEASLKDFTSEARRLNSLRGANPNIVDVIDVFTANNTAYYVMEHLGNNNLRDYVKSRGTLTLSDTYTLMRPIIEAVAYLHESQITHLDIKPANIMLAGRHDGTTRPVLIDFGLSKHYNDDGNATSTINIQGFSDGYAPLEQYGGISKFSPQSDVYALAANILYCLTGHTPPKATDLDSDKAINAIIPRAIPAKVRAVLVKALQNSRALRYDNARLLLRDLDKAIKVNQLSPKPTGRTTKVTTKIKYTVIFCLLLALGIGIGVLINYFTKESKYISTTTYAYIDHSDSDRNLYFMLTDDKQAVITFNDGDYMFPTAVGTWSGSPGNYNMSFTESSYGNQYAPIFFGNPNIDYDVQLTGGDISPYISVTLNNGSPQTINLADYFPESTTLSKTIKEYRLDNSLVGTKWEINDGKDQATIQFISPVTCKFTFKDDSATVNYLYLEGGYLVITLWNYFKGQLYTQDIGSSATMTNYADSSDTCTLKRIE